MRFRTQLACTVTIAAVAGAVIGSGTVYAALASPPVPQDSQVTGNLTVRDDKSGQYPRNQFLVEDRNGAPMLWTNVGATWSGGTPFCVTDLHLHPVACLGGTPGEDGGQPAVTLYDSGKPVTLTVRDLDWLHAQEKK